MTDALDLTVVALAQAVRRREVSPTELVEGAIARIAAADGPLNAVVTIDTAGARRTAAFMESHRDAVAGRPLAGIPFAVKESEAVRGWRSTFGDPGAAHRAPATADSAQVARLRAAGAIPVAATNLALYGGWAETANPLFGTTRNPWDTTRIPGGSSGGSAVAVAAGLVPFATGSDGGGSIRVPAAACGVVGFKPSATPDGADREASGWGTLAVRAPMARTVADLAPLLDVALADAPGAAFTTAVNTVDVRGLRVAWSPTLGFASPDPRIVSVCEAAATRLAEAGAMVSELVVLLDEDPLEMFGVFFVRGVAADVRVARGAATSPALDATVAAWVARAASLTAADVARAEEARGRLVRRVAEALGAVDLLVTPTTAQFPPRIPHPDNEWVQFTHPFNLTGAPALSIPAGVVTVDGVPLPVGVQLVGHRFADAGVVAAGALLESLLGLDLRPPARPTRCTGEASPPTLAR